ncbi:DUF6289 family protein [Novosphingopyxis iocasae]|uniref:DUF6289 family protein n=1 Tax=Novosphingopyxis iocasae TaxID=2762729 RepID=UPI0016510597|nr:DUF6289 family protein [Novosphingopyxis iocasae]
MKLKSKMAKLMLAAVGITAASAVYAAGPYTDYYKKTTYYSDASYQTVVGERVLTCMSIWEEWGEVTDFRKGKIGNCPPL